MPARACNARPPPTTCTTGRTLQESCHGTLEYNFAVATDSAPKYWTRLRITASEDKGAASTVSHTRRRHLQVLLHREGEASIVMPRPPRHP